VIDDPRKLLICGDWHADPNAVLLAYEEANRVGADAILQAGDIIDSHPRFGRMVSAAEFGFRRYGIPLIFWRGNHDDPGLLRELPAADVWPFQRAGEGMYFAQNATSWTWRDKRFGVYGGAASINHHQLSHGIDWWEDECPTLGELHTLVNAVSTVDILLAHDAPRTPALVKHLATQRTSVTYDHLYAESSGELVNQAMWALKPQLLIAGHHHWRHSEVIDRGLGGKTRLEILDKGDGFTQMLPPASYMVLDLDDKLLH